MAMALFWLPSTSSTLPSSAGVLAKPATLGQEAAHLDFRIDAGLELAIDLDDILAVYQRGRIGLFGLDRADVFGRF